MNVLLDINILLDVFLDREEWVKDSAEVFRANHDARIIGHVSVLSLPTLFYIVRRQADLSKAHAVIGECLECFEIIEAGIAAVELAQTFQGSDFEDNLQMACGILAALDAIITRDSSGFQGSPLPAFAPGDFMKWLVSRG